MAIAERTSSGFPMGWVIVALLLAAVLAPMMVMPVEMIDAADYECGGKTEAKAPADMTDEELRTELRGAEAEVAAVGEALARGWERENPDDARPATRAAVDRYNAAYSQAVARGFYSKAPADMDDAELQAALDAAREELLRAEDGGTLEERHDALGKQGSLLNELAHRRGWDLYANAELAEIATSVKAAATTGPVVLIPGLETPVYVSWSHIKERHGFGPFDLLATGPNHQRNCKEEGKVYVYKKAPAPGDTWILGVVWNDVLVTVYEVTRDMLLYYFSADGCPPPLNGRHDGMSTPAY